MFLRNQRNLWLLLLIINPLEIDRTHSNNSKMNRSLYKMKSFLIIILTEVLLAVTGSMCFGQVPADSMYALVIGIRYPHLAGVPVNGVTLDSLRFCDEDARAFAEFISSEKGLAFPKHNVSLLLNQKATRENIFTEMNRLEMKLGKAYGNSLVYFFFSGHGFDQEQETYFLPADVDLQNLENKAISANQLVKRLGRLNPRQLILFIDACHSGGTLDLSIVDDNYVSMAFFSSSKNEQSYEETEFSHGLFTNFLIQGLAGAADNQAGPDVGVVTAGELFGYVYTQVHDYSKANIDARNPQSPYRSRNWLSTFPLANLGGEKTLALQQSLALKTEKSKQLLIKGAELADAVIDQKELIKGDDYLLHNQLQQAITAYHEALKIVPDYALAHYKLCLAYYELGAIDSALAAFKKVQAINPAFNFKFSWLEVTTDSAFLADVYVDGHKKEENIYQTILKLEQGPHHLKVMDVRGVFFNKYKLDIDAGKIYELHIPRLY